MGQDVKANSVHHATLQERIAYLEKTLGDSADKHWIEIQALKAAHAKHDTAHGKYASDLDRLKAAHEKHASIEERINYIESVVKDSADKHAQELAGAHKKIDTLNGRLESDKSAHNKELG